MTLAECAIACKGWRWLPGMHVVRPAPGPNRTGFFYRIPYAGFDPQPGDYPDLSDPATLGCLLALVREAYDGKLVVSIGNGWWSVETDDRDWDQDNTASILEALVAALEAAP